jgi:anti-sigma factor RsiW
MSTQKEKDRKIGCKEARQHFTYLIENQSKALQGDGLAARDSAALESHLQDCRRCNEEYRVLSLTQLTLRLAASPEIIEPNKEFFVALKARIARGPEVSAPQRSQAEESWSATLWLTARQMMPALAMLLLLIIGATVLWSQSPATEKGSDTQAVELQTKVRGLTASDMLDSIVSEERENDK